MISSILFTIFLGAESAALGKVKPTNTPLTGCFLNTNPDDHEVVRSDHWWALRSVSSAQGVSHPKEEKHRSTYDVWDDCPHGGPYRDCLWNTKYGPHAQVLEIKWPTLPASMTKPLVLLVHGGGWMEAHEGWNFTSFGIIGQRFAKHGFIGSSVEYRRDSVAGIDAWGMIFAVNNAIEDQTHAMRFMHNNEVSFGMDATRTAVMGGSSGGIQTLAMYYMGLEAGWWGIEMNAKGQWAGSYVASAIVAFATTFSASTACCTPFIGAYMEACYMNDIPPIAYDLQFPNGYPADCGEGHCQNWGVDCGSYIINDNDPLPLAVMHGEDDCMFPVNLAAEHIATAYCANKNRGSQEPIMIRVPYGPHVPIHESLHPYDVHYGNLMGFLVGAMNMINDCTSGRATGDGAMPTCDLGNRCSQSMAPTCDPPAPDDKFHPCQGGKLKKGGASCSKNLVDDAAKSKRSRRASENVFV